MTQADLDLAAHNLMATSGGSKQHAGKHPYYDHMGGYSMQEMKDYNQYSNQDLLSHKRGYSEDFSDDGDDQMVYVTTL